MKSFNLVGVDGNAFAVMGYVKEAMRESGFSKEDITSYMNDAKSSDYDHLLSVSIDMIEQCNSRNSKHEDSLSDTQTDFPILSMMEIENFIDQYDYLIPDSGKCDTVAGENIRALTKLYYRWYNDGDMAGYGYGLETVGPACSYLYSEIEEVRCYIDSLLNITPDREDDYEQALLILCSAVIDYLNNHKELVDEKNTEDYLDYDEWCGDTDELEERKSWFDDEDSESDEDEDWSDWDSYYDRIHSGYSADEDY